MTQLKKQFNNLRKDNFWGTLIKNSFWAFSGDAMASVINLLITILLIKIIGDDSFGILVLAQSYMNIMDVLINVQSWRSVIQYGQKALVNSDIDGFGSYIKLGCIMDVATAIICCIVAILIAPLIGRIFNWSDSLIISCQILSITIISHFAGTPTAILRLLNKFQLVAFDKFLTAFLKVVSILLYLLIYKKMDLMISVYAFAISEFIGNIVLIVMAFIQYNKEYSIKKMIKAKLPSDKKNFIEYTLWATVSEIVDIPVNHVDVFIVSMLGSSAVSIYKVFKQITSILNKVTNPLQQSILPQFSELSALGKKKRGYEVVIKIRNKILKYTIPLVIVIGLTSPIWLGIIYGDLYKNNWYVLFLYLIIQTIALSFATIHPFFLSLGNTRKEALIIFISNVVYIVLSYLLVCLFGLIGIIVAFGIQVFLVVFLKYIDIKKVISNEEV